MIRGRCARAVTLRSACRNRNAVELMTNLQIKAPAGKPDFADVLRRATAHRLPVLRLDNALVDFADTAAVIGELDLVIAVDTATAHLAGAMARPLWVLLSHVQDWRWMRDHLDSPWYPTARLFRQPQIGDWDGAIAHLTKELAGFVKGPTLRPDNAAGQFSARLG